MAVHITDRDLRLLWWVNSWGAVTVELITAWLGVDFSTAARRVRKLIATGVLRRIEIVGLREPAIAVTEEGRRIANDPLRPLQGIRLSTWQHDCMVCTLEPRLLKLFSNSVLHPDRRIRCNRALAGLPPGHVPDAELHRAAGGRIAIEIELSPKAPALIRAIVDGYEDSQEYVQVFYVVPDEDMRSYVRRFADGVDDRVRVGLIDELPSVQSAEE